MRTLIKVFAAACIMLFAIPLSQAQVTTKHHVKHLTKRRVYKHSRRTSRMAMQLRQGRIHEQQAEQADKVEKKLERDTAGHR